MALELYTDSKVLVTYNPKLGRYGIESDSKFVSMAPTTFKILMELIEIGCYVQVTIKQGPSSVCVAVDYESVTIRFLNFRSRNHRAYVKLYRDTINSLSYRKHHLIAASQKFSYFTTDKEYDTFKEKNSDIMDKPAYSTTGNIVPINLDIPMPDVTCTSASNTPQGEDVLEGPVPYPTMLVN
jgi:hypothetical protein